MDFNKKEMPIQGFAGFGGGATSAAFRSSGSKTYVDDIFSNYLWKGTAATKTITNGIDFSTEGGMVWIKGRDQTYSNCIADTERGVNNSLVTNTSAGFDDTLGDSRVNQFNTDGFRIGNDTSTNGNNFEMASWSWRKSPGFFDCIKYEGNGTSGRTISHSLGCIPGLIIIKGDLSSGWIVYHRDLEDTVWGQNAANFNLRLNSTASKYDATDMFNDTMPTSSTITLGDSGHTNGNGYDYVAYVFAGGKSTSDTTVEFDDTDDRLTFADTSDFNFGTGDFTIEGRFLKDDASNTGFFQISDTTGGLKDSTSDTIALGYNGTSVVLYYNDTSTSASYSYTPNRYTHYAVCRSGSTTKVFVDGTEYISVSDSKNYNFGNLCVGGYYSTSYLLDGKIANFRIVKGQALYTSNFQPSREVFTASSRDHGVEPSNVKLICCNGPTTTSAAVTPGTITAVGNPTLASNQSFFDDRDANVFGEDGDENVIKTGYFIGNGSSTGPVIDLGWEPQWILLKNATASSRDWKMVDAMRGIVTGGDDASIRPNESNAEDDESVIDLTPTGFKITANNAHYNENGERIIYCAIRRPDGYCGKPAEAGTDVFTMDSSGDGTPGPSFISNFPVDFGLTRKPAASQNWYTGARLLASKYLATNTNGDANTDAEMAWDYSNGFVNGGFFGHSDNQAWMWKRGAGFDCVAWEGTNSSVVRSHNLGKTPEMIWYKCRSSSRNWKVYHKGLNGGTNPEDYTINLNQDDPENSNTSYMTGTAPTSTTFVSGNDDDTNGSGKTYIALLFASVDSISKVGYYTGNGSTQTITTGFAPRFAIIRRVDGTEDHWVVLDTTRGWASGDDKVLKLNDAAAQGTSEDMGAPTSTGFSLTSNGWVNYDTGKFIYYAHA